MKKLGLGGKIIYLLNSFCAVLLVLGYLLPYIPPRIFPALSIVSLFLPVLIVLNVLFLLYWLLRGKRQLFLSAFVLALGIIHILSLFRLGSTTPVKDADISVLSYNVRRFNDRNWSEEEDVGDRIHAFIYRENPDIVCFQEFHPDFPLDPDIYPYTDRQVSKTTRRYGQIMYSKFPIIHTSSLDFEDTYNQGIFIDVLVKGDTLRVYNIHFQSLRITPDFDQLKKEDTGTLISRIGTSFKKQESQMQKFLASESQSPYPVIVAGDFNNSATSYLYRKVKGDKNDAFAKAGSGTGATYTFDFVPLRIDFILSDPQLEILDFETYSLPLSDHNPIRSSFKFE